MNAAAPAALAWRVLDVLAILAVLVAAWQGAYDYAGAVAITSPAGTVAFAAALLGSARFWGDVGTTAVALAYSFAIAAALGVFGGLVLGLWRYAADVTEPVLAALYTIPKVTLYPVILLLFGLGLSAKVAFGVIHGVIPVTLFTLAEDLKQMKLQVNVDEADVGQVREGQAASFTVSSYPNRRPLRRRAPTGSRPCC